MYIKCGSYAKLTGLKQFWQKKNFLDLLTRVMKFALSSISSVILLLVCWPLHAQVHRSAAMPGASLIYS